MAAGIEVRARHLAECASTLAATGSREKRITRAVLDAGNRLFPHLPSVSLEEAQAFARDAVASVRPLLSDAAAAGSEPVTEAGAAERFARLHGNDVRFDHRRGRWLRWHGHRWTRDTDGSLTRLVLDFARNWQREAMEIADRDRREATFRAALRLERHDGQRGMLAFAASLPPIADDGRSWDGDPWLLGVPNGVVDLRTGGFRAGRREDRITMCAGIAYDPAAQSALWDAALRAILQTDELIAFMQSAVGYSATGDTRRDCWFLASGSGRNGKGTLIHPIRRALGDYGAELPAAVLDARRDSAPYDLAVLPGKRFVISSEAGDTIRLHHDRIKQISGGDSLRAANKYERSFEFSPVAKLWLAANRQPRVSDDSPAFWARVLFIPFTVSFMGREDRNLRPALEHEPEHQAAILGWIVRGAVRYHRAGLEPPAVVKAATARYERDSDTLGEFLAEAIEPDPASELTAAELNDTYAAWADGLRLSPRERLSSTALGRRMAERFATRVLSGRRRYVGIARKLPR